MAKPMPPATSVYTGRKRNSCPVWVLGIAEHAVQVHRVRVVQVHAPARVPEWRSPRPERQRQPAPSTCPSPFSGLSRHANATSTSTAAVRGCGARTGRPSCTSLNQNPAATAMPNSTGSSARGRAATRHQPSFRAPLSIGNCTVACPAHPVQGRGPGCTGGTTRHGYLVADAAPGSRSDSPRGGSVCSVTPVITLPPEEGVLLRAMIGDATRLEGLGIDVPRSSLMRWPTSTGVRKCESVDITQSLRPDLRASRRSDPASRAGALRS